MLHALRGTLQLDFDGTLAEGDVSVGILCHFLGPAWQQRVEAASRELMTDPNSTALVDTMIAGYAGLNGSIDAYLDFARQHHPARPGLPELIAVADRLGLESHVVSNGFEFYIRDYLRVAGVEHRVEVHTGAPGSNGMLAYLGPDGKPARSRFKQSWAESFRERHDLLIYVGDGTSDLPPARLASMVFARDSLLAHLKEGCAGTLHAFESLADITQELAALTFG